MHPSKVFAFLRQHCISLHLWAQTSRLRSFIATQVIRQLLSILYFYILFLLQTNYSALLFIEFHPIDYKPFLQFSQNFLKS